MMYNCIIVDDEEHAITGLKDYITSFPNLHLLKAYQNPLDALKEISYTQKIDLLFVDADMPVVSGIDLAKAVRSKTKKLVLTTAHSKYAYDAFEVEADAFLLKPYTLAKFSSTIIKLFPGAPIENTLDDDFFFVKNRDDGLKLVKINYEDVVAVESLQNYIKIHTPAEKIVTYISLSEIKKKLLHKSSFIQIHRSFIISKQFITKIDGGTIILNGNLKVTIGASYKDAINRFIKEKTLRTSNS
jgi:two-component system LytT family response regulator